MPIQGICRKIKRAANLYELRWNGKKAVEFCKWLFQDEELYLSHKVKIYRDYIASRVDKFTKYEHLKNRARDLRSQDYSYAAIAKELGVWAQTIYKWDKEGIL
jgi:hypothetical protein